MRRECEPLFERAGDEVDVPHVAVQVAHERFEALDRRTVGITEVVCKGRLNAFAEHVRRSVDVVVQVVAHLKQKIVGGFKLFSLASADQLTLLEFGQRARAVFEKGHPDEALKIAQAAASVLDVGLDRKSTRLNSSH